MALSLFGSANWFRPGLRPNGPSNMRLAIAAWEKGACLALPRVGRVRYADLSDRALHPSQIA